MPARAGDCQAILRLSRHLLAPSARREEFCWSGHQGPHLPSKALRWGQGPARPPWLCHAPRQNGLQTCQPSKQPELLCMSLFMHVESDMHNRFRIQASAASIFIQLQTMLCALLCCTDKSRLIITLKSCIGSIPRLLPTIKAVLRFADAFVLLLSKCYLCLCFRLKRAYLCCKTSIKDKMKHTEKNTDPHQA